MTKDQTPPAAQNIVHPSDFLETVINAARIADPVITGPDGRNYALHHIHYKLTEIAEEGRLPPRPQQRITVDDRTSLTSYANRHSDARSAIIADYDANTITAHLDWHPHNQCADFGASGACSHSVTLKLRPSEEFTRWNAMMGKMHAQDEFAHFIEENSADVAFPEAATMIEISRDFEATVGQTYKSSVRLENGDRRMVFESDTRALRDVVVPTRFTLQIPIWNGEPPDMLTALFRWRAAGQSGAVTFGFEWHRLEHLRRAHFQQIAAAAAEETGLPVFYGRIPV